jgi:hypothetical protein
MAYKSLIANTGTLSEYEEGTFTPVLEGSGVPGTPTYVSQQGYYIRFGKVCIVRIFIHISAFADATGVMRIEGLPFTSVNTGSLFQALYTRAGGVTYSAGDTMLQAYIAPNATTVNLSTVETGNTEVLLAIDTSFFINIDGSYIIET